MSVLAARRMPHALLLAGPAGMGKCIFASKLIQALTCEQPQNDGQGCNFCSGCYLQQVGSHPDHIKISPQEGRQGISVDHIRQIHHQLTLSAKKSRFKTAIIYPAEIMTLSAANSLLKVLEEPPGDSVIILITNICSQLPATIRSRCQQLWFIPPPLEEAKIWLQQHVPSTQNLDLISLLRLVGGAPLRALKYIDQSLLSFREQLINDLFFLSKEKITFLDIAQNWLKEDLEEPLYWVLTFAEDMIRIKNKVSTQWLINPDIAHLLQFFSEKIQIDILFSFLKRIEHDLWLWKSQSSVNSQLLLEKLLIDWFLYFNEDYCEYP
ncbi:DNA polymerase III subunit delta' [Candidatus Nitrosoglobus terrae]|uniref:DNA polymerase III subunit delta' n=2 Tax=Candidatus Nitrosoglobus terrae TaxID=1630141 RepID=A0A1Q2SMT4_9GAMM|nr:DNA polymerase III subunit delta' [Candidatus Nitrosoglobus terrae]